MAGVSCFTHLSAGVYLSPQRRVQLADSLNAVLAMTSSPADSLSIISDLFDLVPRNKRDSIGRLGVGIAMHIGDSRTGLDLIRNISNFHYSSDSLLAADQAMAMNFLASSDRDETVTYIKMMRNYTRAKNLEGNERKIHLQRLISQANDEDPESDLDRMVLLHALAVNLAEISQGRLLDKYITELDSLASTLRPEAYALRNLLCVQASMAYASSDASRAKGIEYDKRLLSLIDAMERGEVGYKHKYRDYDANRYVIYTRLLSNYDNLDAAEEDDYYSRAMAIVASDSVAAATNRRSLRPQIFHAAAHGDDQATMELISVAMDKPYNANIRRRLLEITIGAAGRTGDFDTQRRALLEYNKILEGDILKRVEENWRELEIAYDINRMRQKYVVERKELRGIMLAVSIVGGCVVFVLLVVVFILMRRCRKLSANLAHANEVLAAQRHNFEHARASIEKSAERARLADSLKTAFIKNMTEEVSGPLHTIAEHASLIVQFANHEKQPFLRKYADAITLNSEIVSVMLNDLEALSQLDSGNLALLPRRASLRSLCESAVSGVRHRLQPGVEIAIDGEVPNITLYIDSTRLLQILWQLLSNAAKFTESGSILISATLIDDNELCIAVSDTGIGIPRHQSKRIFQRFVRLDPTIPGAGVGLPLGRKLAELLGGTLILSPEPRTGFSTTFLLTVPVDSRRRKK